MQELSTVVWVVFVVYQGLGTGQPLVYFDSLCTLLVPSAASSRLLAAVGEVQVDAARALLQAE
jgi:hypothetical protein